MAFAGLEKSAEGERGERRVAARAAAVNHATRAVCQALLDQIPRAVYAIVHVHDAPTSVQTPTVLAPVAGRAAVVHVQDGEAATRPILNPKRESGRGGRSRPAVTFDEERRAVVLWGGEKAGARRVKERGGGQ